MHVRKTIKLVKETKEALNKLSSFVFIGSFRIVKLSNPSQLSLLIQLSSNQNAASFFEY